MKPEERQMRLDNFFDLIGRSDAPRRGDDSQRRGGDGVTHTLVHPRVRAHTHALTHARTHTHAHTLTHTHTR